MNTLTGEIREFLRAALIDPVPRRSDTAPKNLTRRRIVVGITFLIGTGVMTWALNITPGDSLFNVATLVLATVWAVGATVSGDLHLGRGHRRSGDGYNRPVAQAFLLGAGLVMIFIAGAVVVAQIPVLAGPLEGLLAHSEVGNVAIVAGITAVNGVAEELFFRGALYAALPKRWKILVTTLAYALTTVGSGVLLLTFAAVVLGVLTALQRRVTGGILAPIVTHLTWSLGMLFVLPPVLDLARI